MQGASRAEMPAERVAVEGDKYYIPKVLRDQLQLCK